jgi:bifunctional ADP-heptose synthase (sugar kinase/adenylyltransferase)
VYVKGSEFRNPEADMTGKIGREEQVIREIGAKLAFTDDIVFSSSNLINRFLSDLPEEIDEYLNLFRQRFTLEQVLEIVDAMASLNVLVLGDTILDEYQYCEAIGKSSKDPILAMKFQSRELFAGGVLAVANHAANFAGHVDLVTLLGEQDSYEEFIRDRLCSNVSPHFMVQPNAPTIVKKRFIDSYSLNKLFEVYVMDSAGLPKEHDLICCSMLRERLPTYDVVIAADFGHGAISPQLADCLSDHARFLCVNTQANAGNRGFHTVTRYKKADYVCISEHEIRLEMRDMSAQIKPMMSLLASRLQCKIFVVTRGRKGCMVRGGDGKFIEVPAFAQRVVDRVGAGDAFLSATSLAAAQAVPEEILGFIGNIVGCLAVEVVGNKKPIDKLSAKKYISALMK